jgi:endonuclease/exonuclease/phosphatase family metal-dependent hydrolase
VHAPYEDKGDDEKGSFYEELGRVFDQFPRYDMKIILGDFSEKVGREKRNIVVRSTMFPHRRIHKYTWPSPDGNTHNQIDHVLIDRRWHSNILDVRSLRGADCGTDHYLVVAKVRETGSE